LAEVCPLRVSANLLASVSHQAIEKCVDIG
jgi:hypothetical protein